MGSVGDSSLEYKWGAHAGISSKMGAGYKAGVQLANNLSGQRQGSGVGGFLGQERKGGHSKGDRSTGPWEGSMNTIYPIFKNILITQGIWKLVYK